MVKIKEFQQYAIQFYAEWFATCLLILIGEAGIDNNKFIRERYYSTISISIPIAFGVGVYSDNIHRNKSTNPNNTSIKEKTSHSLNAERLDFCTLKYKSTMFPP